MEIGIVIVVILGVLFTIITVWNKLDKEDEKWTKTKTARKKLLVGQVREDQCGNQFIINCIVNVEDDYHFLEIRDGNLYEITKTIPLAYLEKDVAAIYLKSPLTSNIGKFVVFNSINLVEQTSLVIN